MTAVVPRAMMALAVCCLGESRREWAAAMQAEFESAVTQRESLKYAAGCLVAALRDLPAREEGRLTLTSHALALGLMIPMAAVQIGCALFGFPYLYPGQAGIFGAVTVGAEHELLLRGLYQGAVPVLALLLLSLGLGHLCIAWAMLDRDWIRATRLATLAVAVATTLILFMSVLFLNISQALLQIGVLAIELATVWMVARWHARLVPAAVAEHPG